MKKRPITVLVPAYRPDRIGATVDTLVRQDTQDFTVRIGYDHAPGYAPPILPSGDFELDVVQHSERKGWVGNVNALLATVETPFYMILAHDDGISPNFLSRGLQALDAQPDAVVAHGATEHRGVRGGELATTGSISGTPFVRASEFIRRGPHFAELGWRGIVRRDLLPNGIRLRSKLSDGQFSNTLYALELLFHGSSILVDDIRYIKNTARNGLSRDLVSRSYDEKSAMLADNLACLAHALECSENSLDTMEREVILVDYTLWLLKLQGTWNILANEKDSGKRRLRDLREPIAKLVARSLLSSVADDV